MEKGFTLAELMIVVAIVGILAAFAIPNYQNYLNRTRVTEAVNLLGPAKIAVSEYAMLHNGQLKELSNHSLNLSSEQLKSNSKNIAAIHIQGNSDNSAQIIVNFLDGLGQLQWLATYHPSTGNISWQCHYANDSIIAQYAPKTCTAAS